MALRKMSCRSSFQSVKSVCNSVRDTSMQACCLKPRTPLCSSTLMSTRCMTSMKDGSRDTTEDFDIIVAGGGLVGTALACLIGKNPLLENQSLLVLEAAPKRDPISHTPKNYSNRVSAITPGTKKLLEEIGAWKHIKGLRHKPFTKMHVWDACGSGYITFNATTHRTMNTASSEEEQKHMAYIVENSVVLSAMSYELQQLQPNISIQYNSRIKSIDFPNQGDNAGFDLVTVNMGDGKSYRARLLIGADGANSVVRKEAKMQYLSHDYQQTAVIATLHLEKDTANEIAWQRFLPTGPIALLPLSSNRSSLVWSTSPENAKTLVEISEDSFVDAVNRAFWEDCDRHPLIDQSGSIVQRVISAIQPGSQMQQPPSVCGIDSDSRALYPLGLGHASHYVNNRVALIGDAAHRIHPLAGQGVNLGASDALCLRDVLVDAVQDGEDIGDLDHLLKYETLRQREVIPMMTGIDLLKRLFSTSFYPFVFARTVGLQATNAMEPLKDKIIGFAMK